jgi:tRNA-2-methylthio-N6-dimethylallyladenosine synthase
MNVYDTRRIAGLLTSSGYVETDKPEEAEAIIFNTCYIREKAGEKVFSELGRLKKALRLSPVFAIVGCMAKAEGDNVFKRAPFVKVVLSSQKYHLLPDMLAAAIAGERSLDLGLSGLEKFGCLPPVSRAVAVEYLQIQEGCDQYCTYCCVPFTRGREVCRPVADVIAEAERLADLGAVELNLVGQNVNSYPDLAGLIREIAKIGGVRRIRFTTSYPSKMTEELVQLFAEEDKLMPLLYLPMQSGSDRILKLMNRKYTREQYIALATHIRQVAPRVKLSSDFIVGFPGESEEDFQDTLSAIREIGFVQSFSFRYSPRPGTVAAKMDDQIPLPVKSRRIAEIQWLLRAQQDEFNKTFIGGETEALFTEIDGDSAIGRNEYQQLVIAPGGAELVGRIAKVKVESASYANLRGKIV